MAEGLSSMQERAALAAIEAARTEVMGTIAQLNALRRSRWMRLRRRLSGAGADRLTITLEDAIERQHRLKAELAAAAMELRGTAGP
ncbi:MAG: hypothetical protein AAGH48_01395 [Pseudomonadota bacterium]